MGLHTLFERLLPGSCHLCGADSNADFLCPQCRVALPRMDDQGCPVCALPAPGGAICGACLAHPPNYDATRAAYRYEFPVNRLVQSLKYLHRLASADFLGRELAALAAASRPDMVIPVPLAPRRLSERGFNQALEIARPLARSMGVPLESRHVSRIVDTIPQATLPWKNRAKNIRHAFECRIDLSGKTVWVVDDVMTTGATLNELAGTLKACGAARVENRVVARALKA